MDEEIKKRYAEALKRAVDKTLGVEMNNEPVAWGWYDLEIKRFFPHWDEDLMENKEGCIPLYTHPVKELNEAIKIIKDFQSDDVPPCKVYEDTYADGWMDACNEILWAIEEKAQEK